MSEQILRALIAEIHDLRARLAALEGSEYIANAGLLDGLHADATGAADAHVVATDASGNVALGGTISMIAPKASGTLTISSDAITVDKGTYYQVDTQGGAASDDLTTINGATVVGQLLILRPVTATRVVTLKDNAANLLLAGDCVLNSSANTITLLWTGSNWIELARSNNG
jgi:hypothetical protein